jgi:hydroxypyruvate isomerase
MMRASLIHRHSRFTRREVLAATLAGAACGLSTALVHGQEKPQPAKLKGRIKQAITPGVLRKMPIERMCQVCAELGLYGIDFVAPADWPTLKKHGLICTMAHSGAGGLNRKEGHEKAIASLRKAIEAAAEAGFPNVICMSGNRAGMSDEEGAANCVEGLKKIAAFAEQKKINVCMELLNSKRNHKDYQCDRTAWGAGVCQKVGSPQVKLLYDIYHMQVQEGDVIATIREYIPYIAHFHTAGVPGRHEIDETQELYYPAVMRAIVDLKFDGYVAHEYSPTHDPVESLKQSVAICDV